MDARDVRDAKDALMASRVERSGEPQRMRCCRIGLDEDILPPSVHPLPRSGKGHPPDRTRSADHIPSPARRHVACSPWQCLGGPDRYTRRDAGGIATYSSVGAKYGYDLLSMMVLITVSLMIVQRWRPGSGRSPGLGLDLIRERFGSAGPSSRCWLCCR
jgi:hypothetical protein